MLWRHTYLIGYSGLYRVLIAPKSWPMETTQIQGASQMPAAITLYGLSASSIPTVPLPSSPPHTTPPLATTMPIASPPLHDALTSRPTNSRPSRDSKYHCHPIPMLVPSYAISSRESVSISGVKVTRQYHVLWWQFWSCFNSSDSTSSDWQLK